MQTELYICDLYTFYMSFIFEYIFINLNLNIVIKTLNKNTKSYLGIGFSSN